MSDIKALISAAGMFGISPKSAVRMRIRALTQDVDDWVEIMERGEDPFLVWHYIEPVLEELLFLHSKLASVPAKYEPRKEDARFTEAEIEQANQFPMTSLIEFVHGKALAPCHDDRRPSLFYGSRKNVAVCPVCDKKFGPVKWLMEVEGMTFPEAMRRLI